MLTENSPKRLDLPPRPRWLDRQGFSTLFAGALLLLISFTTNYGDDNLFQLAKLPAHDKVGMGLHLAALAALAGDVQLATRLRHRARNRAAEDEIARKREAYEAAREREIEQLDIENRRLAALESKLDALLLSADSSSQTPPSTGSN